MMELMRKQYKIAAVAVVTLLLFGYYLFLYRPLSRDLKAKAKECREIEGRVAAARANSRTPGSETDKHKMISEEGVSAAIEEVTAQGKMLGVNFLSITSRQLEHLEGKPYRVLPIEMELESSYEALGKFLGSLDGLRRCLATVRTFETVPASDETIKLKTRFTVNLYVAGP